MRTTLTLEQDVVARLEQLRRERNASLKAVVNEALRVGLDRLLEPPSPSREPVSIRPVALGPRVPEVDNTAEMLAVFEGEDWR